MSVLLSRLNPVVFFSMPASKLWLWVSKLVQTSLLLLLAWGLGQTLMQFLVQTEPPALPNLPKPEKHSAPNVAENLIFGRPVQVAPKAAPVQPIVDTKATAKTKLNLVLNGLIGVGDKGVALILDGNKNQVVAVNEAIRPGVTLVSVFENGVLLDNHGQQETLMLVSEGNDLLNADQKTPARVGAVSNVTTRNQPAQLAPPMRERLDTIGRELRTAPMTIARYIRFQPINEGGAWTGVKLWSKSDAQLYKALGLLEGDILKEVNGKTIAQMSADTELWKTFLKENQFELVVERAGVLESVSVNFNP